MAYYDYLIFDRYTMGWHFFGKMWLGEMVLLPALDEEFASFFLDDIERIQKTKIERVFFELDGKTYMICWIEHRLSRKHRN